MEKEKVLIHFNDSSEDDRPQEAILDVLYDTRDPNEKSKANQTDHEKPFFTSLLDGLGRSVKMLVGAKQDASEPLKADGGVNVNGDSPNLRGPCEQRHRWGYDEYPSSPPRTPSRSSSVTSLSVHSFDRDRSEESKQLNSNDCNVLLDLRETVMQYLRTPDQLYINIILASLKSGMFRVSGDVFELAQGNPILIKTFLNSNRVDLTDERVKAVVQHELDCILAGEPYQDVLTPQQSDYFHCLCRVESVRLTEKQLALIRTSGFEFIKVLSAFPYLRKDIKPVRSCFSSLLKLAVAANTFTGLVSMMISCLFSAAVLWTIGYWIWLKQYGKMNITIVCYLCGYIVNLVCTMRFEEAKIKVYDDAQWPYPSNVAKIVPLIPLYECRLLYVAIRYQLLRNNQQYLVIRYDLRNAMALQQIIGGLAQSAPQIIIQLYFLTDTNMVEDNVVVLTTFFYFLLITCILTFMLSMFSYIQQAILSHSCDKFGFAVMFVSKHGKVARKAMPTQIVTRILLFYNLSFIIGAIVTLLVYLCNMSGCEIKIKTFLVIYFTIIWIDFFALSVTYLYVDFHKLYGLFSLPLILMQVIFFIDLHYTHAPKGATNCVYYERYSVTWLLPLYMLFGLFVFVFLLWFCMCMYELVIGKPIRQQILNTYIHI